MTEKNQEAQSAWLEIARPGRFQDSSGAWHEFTAERLAQMAEAYDPGQREAPLVLGHPATDGPAHGWIKALKWSGRKLSAQAACVTDEIKKAVDNGLYKYVSIAKAPSCRGLCFACSPQKFSSLKLPGAYYKKRRFFGIRPGSFRMRETVERSKVGLGIVRRDCQSLYRCRIDRYYDRA